MRVIISFKLKDGTILDAVVDASSKDAARAWAIKNSQMVFGNSKYTLDTKSRVVDFERWSQDKKASKTYGYRSYNVVYFVNNNPSSITIQASGTKSAYNNVKDKCRLSENVNMFIYDSSQTPSKKSSVAVSKEIVKDGEKVKDVVVKSNDKLEKSNMEDGLISEVKLLFSMVAAYYRGDYKEIPVGTIIGVVACLVYFISPVDLIPDVIPGLGQIDDVGVLMLALKLARKDLLAYKEWLNKNQSTVK